MARNYDYSQHFLRSPRLVAELIGHSNLRAKDIVYDFGAGSGVITSVLARRVAGVVAVENEQSALTKLRENMRGYTNVEIIDGDMLDYGLPDGDYKVFSNPPFKHSSALVQRLAFADNPPKSMYFVAQRQFARKIVPSQHRFTSALAVQLFPLYEARIRRPLRKTDFTPPPAVDTVLLELKHRGQPLLHRSRLADFRRFVAERFENPAKITAHSRQQAGISPERKPSEITPEEWLGLFAAISS